MRSWTGGVASGSREFTQVERDRVARALLLDDYYAGGRKRTTLAEFASGVGLDGRTVRAILADIDGVECVIAYDGGEMWVAEFQEETEGWSRVLVARARAELDRAERRRAFAERHLPRRQEVLL